jgi:ribA/ribD-fused uncharacterized protein
MKFENGLVLFWGEEFSQWYIAPMAIGSVTYNCCEQYMMARKAMLFNDMETLARIMAEKNPRLQKFLGREVKNFIGHEWDMIAQDVIYIGNLAKFKQHPKLQELMFSFRDPDKDVEFVEASPLDKIYGIGLSETDPDALDKSKWKGLNWLGQALTRVRNTLVEGQTFHD